MKFVNLIKALERFWERKGCSLLQPYDIEMGAATFHPATFLGVLGKNSTKVAYVQPSRRPTDGRYADNPLRTQFYYQYQVILKPGPENVQQLFMESLKFIGINIENHDIRFVEDDWESPTLGASGLGWEVWLDSLEITQFTYFQQMGGMELFPITVEITYGLERICIFLQQVDSLYDLEWDEKITYGDLYKRREIESCKYNFEFATVENYIALFNKWEKECNKLLKQRLLYPAYENLLKTSHIFNILDARGALSVAERMNYISRVRKLAKKCAELYLYKNEGKNAEK